MSFAFVSLYYEGEVRIINKEQLRITIGNNIRLERLARKISIEELAEQLNLTPGFVGLIERGTRGTSAYTLARLSEIFNIPIDQIFNKSR